MDLRELFYDIADAISHIDKSGSPFRSFQPGVGPKLWPALSLPRESKLVANP